MVSTNKQEERIQQSTVASQYLTSTEMWHSDWLFPAGLRWSREQLRSNGILPKALKLQLTFLWFLMWRNCKVNVTYQWKTWARDNVHHHLDEINFISRVPHHTRAAPPKSHQSPPYISHPPIHESPSSHQSPPISPPSPVTQPPITEPVVVMVLPADTWWCCFRANLVLYLRHHKVLRHPAWETLL